MSTVGPLVFVIENNARSETSVVSPHTPPSASGLPSAPPAPPLLSSPSTPARAPCLPVTPQRARALRRVRHVCINHLSSAPLQLSAFYHPHPPRRVRTTRPNTEYEYETRRDKGGMYLGEDAWERPEQVHDLVLVEPVEVHARDVRRGEVSRHPPPCAGGCCAEAAGAPWERAGSWLAGVLGAMACDV